MKDDDVFDRFNPAKRALTEHESALAAALDELVHACEDTVDDYDRMNIACETAKKLLPHYTDKASPYG